MIETSLFTAIQPASSLYFAIRTAPRATQEALRALCTLHYKWRTAAVYEDQHQAVTTLNWWHHELEKAKQGELNHPALVILRPYIGETLQSLLHGHMHWHHITRVESSKQLEPTIDAIAGSFFQVWAEIIQTEINHQYIQHAGRALWWIDQTRHIGHSLSTARLWLPMDWLKAANTPASLILKRHKNATERAQHNQQITQILLNTAQFAWLDYQSQYALLPVAQRKAYKSIHALMQQRGMLLVEILNKPQDIWSGLVSVSPRRKWWAALRA